MKQISPAASREPIHSKGIRIPGCTYRLQLNAGFTFADAAAITEYLQQLGVSDCYTSPLLAARPGSTHGYDVCNCAELNREIGSRPQFEEWSRLLRRCGMGLILDIVPNHMSAGLNNPWWRDVLRQGQVSDFADWFDIDWHSADERLRDKVLLPILDQPYWKVLEQGKLQIVFGQEGLALSYLDFLLPLSPGSVEKLEQEILRLCREEARATDSLMDLTALGEVAASLQSGRRISKKESSGSAGLESVVHHGSHREIWPALKRALKRFNGTVGNPESFDALDELLRQQHYRLAYWRLGNEEINYRRFFDVSELVALRTELPEVFEATHRLVVELIGQHEITGLRVDHPDGLWDPQQYFERLQNAARSSKPGQDLGAANDEQEGWSELDRANQPHPPQPDNERTGGFFVVAEKILSPGEALPSDWPVAGTTGYDFLNQLNGLFVNGANREAFDQLYFELTGIQQNFESLVYHAKLKILQTSMRSDLNALRDLLQSIAARTRYGLDFGPLEMQQALRACVAAFPVYRTYVTEASHAPTPSEALLIHQAVDFARQAEPSANEDILSFIHSLLMLRPPVDLDEEGTRACRRFVMKFQQLTGPVMAKGLEDTSFYNYHRLISLNEVGGCPQHFGTELQCFHEQNAFRAQHWPHSLLATATHDTKRGEDLRARINVLSEIPEEWRQAVLKWRRLNAEKKTLVEGQFAPDSNDEYFLYQTLFGAWVSEAESGNASVGFRQRISAYLQKALREAKTHTSWIRPNDPYEQATQHFLEEILSHSQANLFLDDFMLFHRKVAFFGLFNSLAQVVLKLTCPGVPDLYQGTELWDYSLVDPDNRRPVDYRLRKELLRDLANKMNAPSCDVAGLVKQLLKNYQTGQIKLYLIWRLLQLRQRGADLFKHGDYVPLAAFGPKGGHICAFARTYASQSVITVTARLILGLSQGAQRGALEPDVWQDTILPVPNAKPGDLYQNVLTGQVVALRPDGGLPVPEILALLPVAVLLPLHSSAGGEHHHAE